MWTAHGDTFPESSASALMSAASPPIGLRFL
jgi:hypothetical protein